MKIHTKFNIFLAAGALAFAGCAGQGIQTVNPVDGTIIPVNGPQTAGLSNLDLYRVSSAMIEDMEQQLKEIDKENLRLNHPELLLFPANGRRRTLSLGRVANDTALLRFEGRDFLQAVRSEIVKRNLFTVLITDHNSLVDNTGARLNANAAEYIINGRVRSRIGGFEGGLEEVTYAFELHINHARSNSTLWSADTSKMEYKVVKRGPRTEIRRYLR
ncbi:MAG: hypothetical protein LBR07_07925 [Puniceicoccales bacterium]|jgi:hypothetical protein|nr:hypothetical protein [Puniceicoccales bacterium]